MDFEQNNNQKESFKSQGPAPISPIMQAEAAAKPVKKRRGWKIFWGIILTLSVLANIALVVMLIGLAAFLATGDRDVYIEEVIQSGPRTNKIAVIALQGIIDSRQAQDIYKQIKSAKENKSVKGLIFRVNSPGGTVSASDQIYNEIRKYRKKTGKPVVAMMEGLAVSGGYYTSVACDEIVSEPTAITGSVGVIFSYFVLQELLEEKLGILPVVSKSGEKKDWPSSFRAPTEEQQIYIQEKLIKPAYERFVQIVAESRASLTKADARRLSDGSIYGSKEALEEKLIDEIGYLDEAIERVKSLAGLKEAQVVQYRKPFSLGGFLGAHSRNIMKIDKGTFYELSTPEVLYLWSGY